MKIKELKNLIKDYDNNAEFIIAVADHAEILTFDEFGQDDGYEEQALCLTVSLEDNCYFSYDKEDND